MVRLAGTAGSIAVRQEEPAISVLLLILSGHHRICQKLYAKLFRGDAAAGTALPQPAVSAAIGNRQ